MGFSCVALSSQSLWGEHLINAGIGHLVSPCFASPLAACLLLNASCFALSGDRFDSLLGLTLR